MITFQRVLSGVGVIVGISTLISCTHQAVEPTTGPAVWPVINSAVKKDENIELRVKKLLNSMTLEQKVAQIVQPEIGYMTVEDMRVYGFGTYQNGGNSAPNNVKRATPQEWLAYADEMYKAALDDSIDGSVIPTMWGTDAVHGHSNVYGATLYPHNIGLGAANNPELIKKIAIATAEEVAVTGIDWAFAPTVAVPRNDRWGRTYEGYSEDPEIVAAYASQVIEGLQGEVGKDFLSDRHIIATTKHFVGDGGTGEGLDRGDMVITEQELRDIHAAGYLTALASGAQSVMASFNSWNGKRLHEHRYLLTDVLKNRLGFDGFIVTDWYGHTAIEGCTHTSCAAVINAGVDVVMAPEHYKEFYANTLEQVRAGEIAMSRIDDAVTRLLRVKMRMGLFEKQSPSQRPLAGKLELFGSEEHRDIARQAVRESLVLLKNKNKLLPLKRNINVLVVGDGAHNIAKQSGGWSVSWQGTDNTNEDFPGATSIYSGIKNVVEKAGGTVTLMESYKTAMQGKPDVVVAIYGEEPYAEWFGDIKNLEYQRGNKRDLEMLRHFKAMDLPVVSVFISGRPLWVNKELNASDAFVATWLPGSEGGGVAEVLFKNNNDAINYDFKGRLSFSWPMRDTQTQVNRHDESYDPLFPYGYGLSYGDIDNLSDSLPEFSSDTSLVAAAGQVLPLFKRDLPKDIVFNVGDSPKSMKTVINTDKASQKAASLSLQAITRDFQEDARRLNWLGESMGVVELEFNRKQDWVEYLRRGAVLAMDLRVVVKASDDVSLVMGCGENCGAEVAVQDVINALPQGEWRKVTFDLNCWAQAGMDYSSVLIPWRLTTSGLLDISVANIEVVPNFEVAADISCR